MECDFVFHGFLCSAASLDERHNERVSGRADESKFSAANLHEPFAMDGRRHECDGRVGLSVDQRSVTDGNTVAFLPQRFTLRVGTFVQVTEFPLARLGAVVRVSARPLRAVFRLNQAAF